MFGNSRIISILFVIVYAILCYLVFFTNLMDMNNMALAMKLMGVGMLAEALIDTYNIFRHHNQTMKK